MHILDQKRSKLDDKGEKCIFLSVSKHSKTYKLYNLVTKKIVISRDVIFDEERFWFWDENNSDHLQADFDGENEEEEHYPLENAEPVANEQQIVANPRISTAENKR